MTMFDYWRCYRTMVDSITLEKINDIRAEGFNCAQVVFAYGAEKLGLDRETALKIAGAFGWGMYNGETCGAVTGALMALGLKYGQCQPYDMSAKSLTIRKQEEFEDRFREAHNTLICKELLGYDISNPVDRAKIMEEGLLNQVCPFLIWDACQIIDDMI